MRLRCTPVTFEVAFGKEFKDNANLLIQALEIYLSNIDLESVRLPSSSVTELARILFELKVAPLTGYTPRCRVTLNQLFDIAEIMHKYAESNKVPQARYLAAYFRAMHTKMSEVKWE